MYAMSLVARFVLSAVFLTSSAAKRNSSSTMVQSVQQLSLGLFRPKLVHAVVWLLPPFEFILALALIINVWPKVIALLVLGLLISFTVPMVINLAQGNRFPCHCFGHMSSDIGVGSLSRNSILIVMSLLLVLVSPWTVSELGLFSIGVTRLSGSDIIALLTAGISLYFLLLTLSEIDTLLRSLWINYERGG